nr:hypothetical protein CFP56_70912 [Quercus suber]
MSSDYQDANHQYGDWLRAGWDTKETTKEKNTDSRDREATRVQGTGEKASLTTGDLGGPSSESFWAAGSVGENQSLGKGETLEDRSNTPMTRQSPEDLQPNSKLSEQVMSTLDHGDKSRAQQNIPAPDASNGPKGLLSQRSPSKQASLDMDEDDSPIKQGGAVSVNEEVSLQAKAQEKGKQVMSKGRLKKIAREKGKTKDEETLAQFKEMGIKRLRRFEASEDDEARPLKRLCEEKFLGNANLLFEAAATALQRC